MDDRPLTPRQRQVLEAASHYSSPQSAWVFWGDGGGSIYDHAHSLIELGEQGYLSRSKFGDRWSITDKGREALR